MNILIAFGSTEGQTRKIVHHINTSLEGSQHSFTMFDCAGSEPELDINSFDAFIVAGSVHQEAHQPYLVDFVKDNLAVLDAKPGAFISVSLSISLPDGRGEAEKYVDEFVKETGWEPQEIHLAAGAIRFLEYDFFKRFTVEHMVLQGKKMPDKSSGNPEYTNWNALDKFVETFIAGLTA